MYKSVKAWLNIQFTLHSFVKRDGTGKATYTDEDQKCYAEGKVVVVTSKTGQEQTSTAQLYVDGSLAITDFDEVTFEGRRRPIVTINTFYDGNGKPDIKVVYL